MQTYLSKSRYAIRQADNSLLVIVKVGFIVSEKLYRVVARNMILCNKIKNILKARKMTVEMLTLIEEKIREKWRLEKISGWLRVTINKQISHETLYKHIWADKKAGGELFTFLRRQGKAYQSCSKSLAGRGHIKNRVSIEEWPDIFDEKSRIGDWEID